MKRGQKNMKKKKVLLPSELLLTTISSDYSFTISFEILGTKFPVLKTDFVSFFLLSFLPNNKLWPKMKHLLFPEHLHIDPAESRR